MIQTGLCILALASSVYGTFRGKGLLQDALHFGTQPSNLTREDCIYRRDANDSCPGQDILFLYYTIRQTPNGPETVKQIIEFRSPAWLHSSGWDHSLPTVLIVHGYGGVSQDYLPAAVLRDAYLSNGKYNVFMVDWGRLAAIPCYAAAVYNLKSVSRCIALMLSQLRNAGLNVDQLTCVGHSLGAHMCGMMANYLPFRMHRIIGIDPARPLIRNRAAGRLDSGDAEVVQVIHATANYGDLRRMGHVDFCLNGGHVQPFCLNASNSELCSHSRSVCYVAESLNPDLARKAFPCARRCMGEGSTRPVVNSLGQAPYVQLGQHTPDEIRGIYCVVNTDAPYCSKNNVHGSPYCCAPTSSDTQVQIQTGVDLVGNLGPDEY
ncbi:phospholipase A1-like [Adelges cooleyi]|uniref:phospholipase A1-like n=1 Tax=Adelges cooleyi TaxID=133065 RepID=UPI00217F3C82|nr:phospholipase A1-like [Adelges cooleyi]XP_050443052.1 phospholipase A1-like [Adelges cooleyi]